MLQLPWTGMRFLAARTMAHAQSLRTPQALGAVRVRESRGMTLGRQAIPEADSPQVGREIRPNLSSARPPAREAGIESRVAFPTARDFSSLVD
jgi:hypothetical protein